MVSFQIKTCCNSCCHAWGMPRPDWCLYRKPDPGLLRAFGKLHVRCSSVTAWWMQNCSPKCGCESQVDLRRQRPGMSDLLHTHYYAILGSTAQQDSICCTLSSCMFPKRSSIFQKLPAKGPNSELLAPLNMIHMLHRLHMPSAHQKGRLGGCMHSVICA
jgi:hypothetical protein